MKRAPSWEQRMAERSAARRREAFDAEVEAVGREIEAAEAATQARAAELMDGMTPEQARATLDRLSGPCGCLGGPLCCMLQVARAREVLGESS